MKTAKSDRSDGSTKAERRAHRKTKERKRRHGPLGVRPGGGFPDPDLLEQILAMAEGLGADAAWPEVAPMVLPVLRRVRHPYPPEAAPMHLYVPPGVWTGFGIDLGPAFTHVTAGQVQRWGLDHATLLGTALENLRRLALADPPRVERVRPDGVETTAIQGQGWGSALVLLPEVLQPILGSERRVLLAPVRNTLLALPEDADPDLAFRLWEAVADGAHDELDMIALRWTGTGVVSDGEASVGLPN
jgi:hypothetical protein